VFAVHPGVIFGTGLSEGLDMSLFGGINEVAKKYTGREFVMGEPKSLGQGVATTIRAAVDPGLVEESGSYLADCGVVEVREYARDEEMVTRLWRLSEELVGDRFEL